MIPPIVPVSISIPIVINRTALTIEVINAWRFNHFKYGDRVPRARLTSRNGIPNPRQ